MEYILDFSISKYEKKVQTAAFEVPSSCLAICFLHDLPEQIALLVNMIVEDPSGRVRFQKQLGYSEKVIGLGQSYMDTTIGGISNTIEAGTWTIKVILASEYVKKFFADEKINFTITVTDEMRPIEEHLGEDIWADADFRYAMYDTERVFNPNKRWYKGDFHTHTRLSDGKETPERVMEKAHFMNLDFYAATEHNVMHTGWPKTDILVLPGVEITTSIGHANLFGLKKRPDFLDEILENDNEELLEDIWNRIAVWCKEQEALLSINHPFLYLWKWKYSGFPLEYLSCLEIVNDPTYAAVKEAKAKEANMLAIRMADCLWADGYRICAIGGSDSHNRMDEFYDGATENSIAGDPATWLYMEGLYAGGIYKELKSCSACVTRYVEDLDMAIYANGEKVLPGAILPNSTTSLEWKIFIKSQDHFPKLFVLVNGQRQELLLESDDGQNYVGSGVLEIPKKDYCWIRFGAESIHNEFMMYANPITRGKTAHKLYTFEDVKAVLEI